MIVEHGRKVITSPGGFSIRNTKTLNTISKIFTLQKRFSTILIKKALAIEISHHLQDYCICDLHEKHYTTYILFLPQICYCSTVYSAHSTQSQRREQGEATGHMYSKGKATCVKGSSYQTRSLSPHCTCTSPSASDTCVFKSYSCFFRWYKVQASFFISCIRISVLFLFL